jgi:hypothetical protein
MRKETERQVREALSGGKTASHCRSELPLAVVSSKDPGDRISRDSVKVSEHRLALRNRASPNKSKRTSIFRKRADEGAVDGEACARRPPTTLHLAVSQEAFGFGGCRAHPSGPINASNSPWDA